MNTQIMQSNLNPHSSLGFSLIELMIAITLGLLLIAGVGYAYLGTRATNRVQENLAGIQESARYAFEAMATDIRMTGYVVACDITSRANMLNGATADGSGWTASSGSLWYANIFAAPLRGFEQGETLPTGISSTKGDTLGIIHADNTREYIVTAYASPTITLTTTPALSAGDILIAADCSPTALQASLFQASAVNTGAKTITHATGGTGPGNCASSANLFGNGLCPGAGGSFSNGSRVFKVSSHFYYIKNTPTGQPALFRQTLSPLGGATTTVAEELVPGVEDMQISYGVDTSTPEDGAVDKYLKANEMNVTNLPGTTTDAERWARVLSVKITLLLRSADDGVTTTPQAYTFNGATQLPSPSDRRLRKVFTTTIAVRNRI